MSRARENPSMDVVPTLVGGHLRLEPLSVAHAEGLALASDGDRRTFGWTRVPEGLEDTIDYVRTALRAASTGMQASFAVITTSDDRVVGTSRFLNMERWTDRPSSGSDDGSDAPDTVEIGSTWYAPEAQGTFVNPETKLLMLRHAFEVWNVQRVQLRTDARNERSRAAIARLGASFEGVLRRAHPGSGDEGRHSSTRDTAVYSIVPDEWPGVEAGLLRRIDDLSRI